MMHSWKLLALVVLMSTPVPAQRLTAVDSAQIIELAATELRKDYPVLLTNVFATDSLHGGFGVFARRLLIAVRRGDSLPRLVATRLTPRVSMTELTVAGDTVRFHVTLLQCRNGVGAYSGYGRNYEYAKAGSGWAPTPHRLIEQGNGSGCPW